MFLYKVIYRDNDDVLQTKNFVLWRDVNRFIETVNWIAIEDISVRNPIAGTYSI